MPLSIESIIRDYNDDITRFAESFCRLYRVSDETIALDVVQEVYLKIMGGALANLRGTHPYEVRSYLRKVVRTSLWDTLKRYRPSNTSICSDSLELAAGDGGMDENPETLSIRSELLGLILSEVDGMGEEYSLLFRLIHIDGRTQKEAAVILDVVQSVISDRCAKIRKVVKKAMDAYKGGN